MPTKKKMEKVIDQLVGYKILTYEWFKTTNNGFQNKIVTYKRRKF